MKTPRIAEVIRQLESVKRQHGDVEFWIQVHHAERPMNYGERNLREVHARFGDPTAQLEEVYAATVRHAKR